jgi:hypothetical protein
MRAYGLASGTVESIIKFTNEGRAALDGGFFSEWGWGPIPADAAVDRARSILATEFQRGRQFDVCLMVDDDIGFQSGDLEYVAKMAYELDTLVGGMVSKRAGALGFGGRICDGKRHELYTNEIVELGPHQYLGGALMAFPCSILDRIVRHGMPYCALQKLYNFFGPQVIPNEEVGVYEYLSEDWSICHNARESGSKVYALMRPVTVHLGAAGFTALDGNQYHINEAKDAKTIKEAKDAG